MFVCLHILLYAFGVYCAQLMSVNNNENNKNFQRILNFTFQTVKPLELWGLNPFPLMKFSLLFL